MVEKKRSSKVITTTTRTITGKAVTVKVQGEQVAMAARLKVTVGGKPQKAYLSSGINTDGVKVHRTKQKAVTRAGKGLPLITNRLTKKL